MELLPYEVRRQLLDNGRKQKPLKGTDKEIDFWPVVKLFTPDAQATWLLTELVPDDPNTAFGLCDLGMGSPELGYVSISELSNAHGSLVLPIERDLHFQPKQSLNAYTKEAREAGRIVT